MSLNYHPPTVITNNAAPISSADLMYEEHGKCYTTRILRSDSEEEGGDTFDSEVEETRNAWKMVFLTNTALRTFWADNISELDCMKIANQSFAGGIEIMADIRYVRLDYHVAGGIVILYIDCSQS